MGWDCVSTRKFEEIGALFICRYHLRTRMCRCNAGWKHEQSKHYDRSLLKAIISWLAGSCRACARDVGRGGMLMHACGLLSTDSSF